MNNYFRQYDFESIVTASTVIYSFASGAPAAIWFVLGQFGVTTRIADIVCLYGYSMFVFIPATVREENEENKGRAYGKCSRWFSHEFEN